MKTKVCKAIALGIWSFVASTSLSVAQTSVADPQRGHELATRLCVNCHVVDRQASGAMRADIPTFTAIANRPEATAEYLAGRIIVPHPAMPGVPLTAAEIRDIVTYIISLKRNP
jgi:mono/diheme cytochrome c family protein